MKKILGLDLGTNSIGWALIDKENQKILGMGSRIIPMGTDKADYEKGVGVTKNADRRTARTIRKMGKRYKLRRNKLLFILNELEMLPSQFQFRHKVRDENGKSTNHYQDGFPKAENIQDVELLPIKKGTLQLDSLQHFELKVKALTQLIDPKDFGKILYQFNQLRGYSGGSNKDDSKKEKEDDDDGNEDVKKKKYEVVTQKVEILKVEKSDRTFKVKGGKNKGEELPIFDITILVNDEEKEGSTILQNLEAGKEGELEVRIRYTKSGETITFALPQKTNWRKQMEATEEILKTDKLYISELLLNDLKQNKWSKIRNRVVLRNRYKQEFDCIWQQQAKQYSILGNCPKEKLEKIARYLYPGPSETQEKLRTVATEKGLKHIIKEQVIYYQRPLKSQKELISKCQFEKEETVLANSHPLFQEFRCWEQINKLFITSKIRFFNEKKQKDIYEYSNQYLTKDQKNEIYSKLQNQKQVGFNDIAKIVDLKSDKTEFLNGLNVKAKLKGCDTAISIKKILGGSYNTIVEKNKDLIIKIWDAIYNTTGNEYDVDSDKVSLLILILKNIIDDNKAIEMALKLAQNINYPRKYVSLSAKAIQNILPLMQCRPINNNEIKERFEKIKHTIETGEIDKEDNIETYMIDYIHNNSNILETGGMMYAFASSLIYGKHTAENIKRNITNYHDIKYNHDRNLRNPIVEQITNETMQVIKAIWKQYEFNPEELEIRVELARDLKNSAAEREKIYKGQIDNQRINEAVKKRLIELKQEPTQGNIDLYKLWSKQNLEDYPKQSKEPTQDEVQRLRIWEEQKCISPYTLRPIPLSKLFSPERLYDIDHIIPKSRFFDDSISNKVVCETDINEEKGNRTSWEYITQQNSKFGICSVESYINHINSIFFGKKKKNLLAERIPTNPVERQIKETQYIAVAIKNELAKIVGSDNIKSTTGEVTAFLRGHWGLKKLFMKLTEDRFRQMELWDWNKQTDSPNIEWVKNYFDREKQKHVYEIKNWSKRYDHRHHAIDALVVALTEQSYIQRLNNLNKVLQDELIKRKGEFKLEVGEDETVLEAFFNLEEKRRREIQNQIESSRKFDLPFTDLVNQAEENLKSLIVSHKPKDKLTIQVNEKNNKKGLKIRAALHEATFYGKLNGQDTKTVHISNLSAKDIDKIIDDVLEVEINNHRKNFDSMKEAFTGEGLKAFNESRFQRKKPKELKPPVYKIKIRYNTKEDTKSKLQRLYDNNDKLSVKTGDNYLFLVMEKDAKNGRERVFDIASLYDSADIAKRALSDGIENFKKQICEDYRIKHKEKPDKILFTLQQNDLVYMPENIDDLIMNLTKEEFINWINIKENKASFSKRVYKVVKFTGKDCFFIPHNYANTISAPKELSEQQKEILKKNYGEKKIPKQELNFEEFGSFGTSAKTEMNMNFVKELVLKKDFEGKGPLKIQDYCLKLKNDWLGNISFM